MGYDKHNLERIIDMDIERGNVELRCPRCRETGKHEIYDTFRKSSGVSAWVKCGKCDYTRLIFTLDE